MSFKKARFLTMAMCHRIERGYLGSSMRRRAGSCRLASAGATHAFLAILSWSCLQRSLMTSSMDLSRAQDGARSMAACCRAWGK